MKPIADSLDHLQGDKYCYMGDVIPTLLRTKEKLSMLINKHLTYCTSLCRVLLKSLQSRFGDYLTLDESVWLCFGISDTSILQIKVSARRLQTVVVFGQSQARNCTFLCGLESASDDYNF